MMVRFVAYAAALGFVQQASAYTESAFLKEDAALYIKEETALVLSFALHVGLGAGETQCIEGSTDCITISGFAKREGDGYIFYSQEYSGSTLIIVPKGQGFWIKDTVGDFGTGSANRFLLNDVEGVYGDVGNFEPETSAQSNYNIVTPSGNIECNLWISVNEELRCDMSSLTPSFTVKPEDCPVDWGSAFGMFTRGRAEVLCIGDTIVGPPRVVIEYGQTLQYGNFTCTSEKTGLTCINLDGHGFKLSKAKQVLF